MSRVLRLLTLCLLFHSVATAQVGAESNRTPEAQQRASEHFQRGAALFEEGAYRAAHPDAQQVRLPKEQSQACKWSPEGLRVRLRLEAAGLDCDLHDALALTSLREGDRLVVSPRWAADERLPEAQRLRDAS